MEMMTLYEHHGACGQGTVPPTTITRIESVHTRTKTFNHDKFEMLQMCPCDADMAFICGSLPYYTALPLSVVLKRM